MKLKDLARPHLLKNQQGFSLIEMIIVIALIALVGTFAVQNIMGRFQKAKVDGTKIQIRQLSQVLQTFYSDCGFYPTTEQGLEALVNKPQGGRECRNYDPNGYLQTKKVPRDGFDLDFVYISDGAKFEIKSLGQDGREGGEGIAADISSNEL